MLPGEERIRGEHIASYAQRLKEEGGYERRFLGVPQEGAAPGGAPQALRGGKKGADGEVGWVR